ncbi:MAG: hypothetical protein JSW23_08220 [Planctomycetota bacterium]|nr:MAG: hypothetical protein JSW23_08220 [Planctomycetota bacterium]
MNPWFEFLFILGAFVFIFSGFGWGCIEKTYNHLLETKFPSETQDFSTRQWWRQTPIEKVKRWKKATKLGDDKLAIVAKRCYLLMYVTIAAGMCMFLLILIHM